MSGFQFEQSPWTCDGVLLDDIVREVGTPTYVYSGALVRARVRALDSALGDHPHAVHYALKANSTLALVRLLRDAGCRADANAMGEIDVALRAGFSPAEIVFTGVGKTSDELERAVALGVGTINAESAGELRRIDAMAHRLGRRARVAVRVNPDVDARSHPHISTGLRANKFGVAFEDIRPLCRWIMERERLNLGALHVHIGSQIATLEPVRRAAGAVSDLAVALRAEGIGLDTLDVGGGLGISYDGSPVPTLEAYAHALVDIVKPTGLTLVVEPGRSLVGPAGALLARVVDVKPRGHDRWCVVADAGMTELLRPALYGAFHRIVADVPDAGSPVVCDIVGPVCESSDTLGADRRLPLPDVGALLAVLDTGAYGSAMASNYNRRPMPAEVLVDGGWRVVRRRQTVDDMLACEA